MNEQLRRHPRRPVSRLGMLTRLLIALAAVAAVLVTQAGTASAAPIRLAPTAVRAPLASPVLTGATIKFFTFDDDKDFDTFLRADVLDSNGRLAALTTGFFGVFPDQTVRGPFAMSVRSGVTKDILDGGQVHLRIVPNGNDTWRFGFEVDLTFSDGSFEPVVVDSTQLTQNSRDGSFPFLF
jgi:hypothetical protein